jgi:hypothetical protein
MLVACLQLEIMKGRAVRMCICFQTMPIALFLILFPPVTAFWDVCKLHEDYSYTLCTGVVLRVFFGRINKWRLSGFFPLPLHACAGAQPGP